MKFSKVYLRFQYIATVKPGVYSKAVPLKRKALKHNRTTLIYVFKIISYQLYHRNSVVEYPK